MPRDIETMTIREIIDECISNFNCGDCQIEEFCQKNLDWKHHPCGWVLKEEA